MNIKDSFSLRKNISPGRKGRGAIGVLPPEFAFFDKSALIAEMIRSAVTGSPADSTARRLSFCGQRMTSQGPCRGALILRRSLWAVSFATGSARCR